MVQNHIATNLETIRGEIAASCRAVGRRPEDVRLLLATKTVSVTQLQAAVEAGAVLFGENRAQELRDKAPFMATHKEVEWHFIGHLQRNKVKDVLPHVTLIHSVDRLRLGRALHNRLAQQNRSMDILVQVNTSYETSKFGVAPEDAVGLVRQLTQFETLNVKGLMTIGKFGSDADETRRCFRRLKALQTRIQQLGLPRVEMDVLSMGMSGDFKIAIEEGATIVRIGTSVFGARSLPDSYYWNERGK